MSKERILLANGGQEVLSFGFLGLAIEGSFSFKKFNKLCKWENEYVGSIQSKRKVDAVHDGKIRSHSFSDFLYQVKPESLPVGVTA